MRTDPIQELRSHLSTHQDDWESRFILADALEDASEPVLANGQRWQSVNQKRPLYLEKHRLFRNSSKYGWFNSDMENLQPTPSSLNFRFHDQRSGWLWFPTLEHAEIELAEQLDLLGIETWKKLPSKL